MALAEKGELGGDQAGQRHGPSGACPWLYRLSLEPADQPGLPLVIRKLTFSGLPELMAATRRASI